MYITAYEIQNSGIESLINLDCGTIENKVDLISKEIDEYCNTRFEPTKDIYILDLKKKFFTPKQPLIHVKNLYYCGEELIENIDFFVYPEKSRIELNNFEFNAVKKVITVEYLYGYVDVPSTVKQVIIDLLNLDENSKNSNSIFSMQSESFDGEYTYSRYNTKDFTPAELRKNILNRLNVFKVEPYIETESNRFVKARLL